MLKVSNSCLRSLVGINRNNSYKNISKYYFCSETIESSTISKSEDPKYNEYRHPLITRYASKQMRYVWSEQNKFSTWRRLWVALAYAQMELGVEGITTTQIDSMRNNVNNIDFEYAAMEEKKLRHDVMAHIHTFGHQVPSAAGIIHLGATSCFVQDNGDLCQIKQSGEIVLNKLLKLISELRNICMEHRYMACLGYTHLQPAQLTTVGKRFSLYLQDFYWDYLELKDCIDNLYFRGSKGTTGTQASFLHIFNNDHNKVIELDNLITSKMGFKKTIPLCGQTYSRKQDYKVLTKLSNIGQSAHKMCTDIRLLASFKEIEEPFEKSQVGSSAMAYKRNPMRSERVCSLGRYLINLPVNISNTHSIQWMERSLDDSAIRRMVLPEAFMCSDAILDICTNIIDGITIWPNVIEQRVLEETPFMATENILMELTKQGGNRQELHELIRLHSMEAAKNVKEKGIKNDLINRILNDSTFKSIHKNINDFINPSKFIGRAPEQVNQFIQDYIDPLIKQNKSILQNMETTQLNV